MTAATAPTTDSDHTTRASSDETWIFGALLVLAAMLRLRGLTTFPFEQDELYTFRDALTLRVTHTAGQGIGARPVYYLLQHLLLRSSEATPFVLRVLPYLFGLLGIFIVWRLACRLFDRTGGLIAAAITVFSPWHFYASGMARYWTLVFALSALSVLCLTRALETRTRRDYLLAWLVLALGALTHPSFAFAAAGFCAALFLVDGEGRFRLRLPERAELLFLWLPLVLTGITAVLILKSGGSSGAVRNGFGRGFYATVRIVPAIIEWMTTAVAAAAAGAAVLLVANADARGRRFGVMTILACASSLTLLVLSGFLTDVYADYGMAMLPLIYVCIGGGVSWLAKSVTFVVRPWLVAAFALVLVAAEMPGLVSNLIDGMRYDVRTAYRYVLQFGPEKTVVGGPAILQRHYGAGLRWREWPLNGPAGLQPILDETGGFWIIAPYVRRGLLYDDGWGRRWIEMKCRTVLRTEHQRIDYREYRLDLAWCGASPAPGPYGYLPWERPRADSVRN